MDISESLDVLDDLTINLNGKTITYTGDDTNENGVTKPLFNVKSGATLTINGTDDKGVYNENSSVVSTTSALLATANAGGQIKINGGKYEAENATGIFSIAETGTVMIDKGYFLQWNPEEYNFMSKGRRSVQTTLNTKEYFNVDKIIENFEIKVDPQNPYQDRSNEIQAALQNPFVDRLVIDDDCIINNTGSTFKVYHDITIESSNNTINTGSGTNRAYGFEIYGAQNVTLKNLDIVGGGIYASNVKNLLIENCRIRTTISSSGRHAIMVYGTTATIKNCNIQVGYNGTASGINYIYTGTNSTVTVETIVQEGYYNGIFEGASRYIAGDGTGSVVIKGGTFNFNPSSYVPQNGGYTITKSGSNWTVTPPSSTN